MGNGSSFVDLKVDNSPSHEVNQAIVKIKQTFALFAIYMYIYTYIYIQIYIHIYIVYSIVYIYIVYRYTHHM